MRKKNVQTDVVKTTRLLRVVLTSAELLQLGRVLADLNARLGALRCEKKTVVSDFAAKIASVEADAGIAISAIRTGCECRAVSCSVHLGLPEAGRKTTVRDDTGETVDIADMTADELQACLALENSVPAVPEGSRVAVN
jgi:hypothetical protein